MNARGARRAQMTRPEVADQRPAGGFMHDSTAPLNARGAFEPLPCREITVLYDLLPRVRWSTSSACADLRKRMHKINSDVTSDAYVFSVVQNGDFLTSGLENGAFGSQAPQPRAAAPPMQGVKRSRAGHECRARVQRRSVVQRLQSVPRCLNYFDVKV